MEYSYDRQDNIYGISLASYIISIYLFMNMNTNINKL